MGKKLTSWLRRQLKLASVRASRRRICVVKRLKTSQCIPMQTSRRARLGIAIRQSLKKVKQTSHKFVSSIMKIAEEVSHAPWLTSLTLPLSCSSRDTHVWVYVRDEYDPKYQPSARHQLQLQVEDSAKFWWQSCWSFRLNGHEIEQRSCQPQ